jgi:hypothetical protein
VSLEIRCEDDACHGGSLPGWRHYGNRGIPRRGGGVATHLQEAAYDIRAIQDLGIAA